MCLDMKKKIVVRIQWWLWNQMFQYAYAYALSKRKWCEFLLDISTFDWYKVRKNHLSEFSILPPYANKGDIPFYERYPIFHKNLIIPRIIKSISRRLNPYDYREVSKWYDEKFSNLSNGYVIWYFQSERYFKDYEGGIRKIFSFSKETENKVKAYIWEKNIKLDDSVAISVRRGDFSTDGAHYLIPFEWYYCAYKEYFKNKKILVFSDDIQQCREYFWTIKSECLDIVFVDKLAIIESLCLMSKCHNFIISNSTFSWWWAYLPDYSDKIVVRPDLEFDRKVKGEAYYHDHYPKERISFKW